MRKTILIVPERFINRSFQQIKSNQTFRDALHTHTHSYTPIHTPTHTYTHTQAVLILNGFFYGTNKFSERF